jgi:hypothetical protein
MAVRGNGDALVERPVEGVDFARRFVILLGAHATLRSGTRALIDHLVKTAG